MMNSNQNVQKTGSAAGSPQWGVLDVVLQGSPVATFVIDSEHRVTHWNRACEIVTGVLASEIIGTCNQWRGFYPEPRPVLADLIVAGDIDKALENYKAGHCQRSPVVDGAYEADGFFPHAGGAKGDKGRWLYFTAAPVHDEEGKVVGAIETLQDITERKLAEQALQEQFDNLEKLVDVRTAQLQVAKQALENDIARRQVIEDELRQRNLELLELSQTREKLQEQVSYASNTAMTAMSSMGEMGVLIQALQHFNGCQDFQEVAESVASGLTNYDLIGTVQVRAPHEQVEVSTRGEVSEHDTAIFARLKEMGRIVHFHSRMIINYDRVSLLIHNIPKDDVEKTGRIRDNVAILAEAADARISALLAEGGTLTRQDAILKTVEQIRCVLSAVERGQQDAYSSSSLAIHNMMLGLEKLFVHLGLTQGQEDSLLELINTSVEQLTNAQSGQLNFQDELSAIIKKLEAFSSSP